MPRFGETHPAPPDTRQEPLVSHFDEVLTAVSVERRNF